MWCLKPSERQFKDFYYDYVSYVLEDQIIGGIVPNLIAFGLFLGAIGYFALTTKMAEMFAWKNKK